MLGALELYMALGLNMSNAAGERLGCLTVFHAVMLSYYKGNKEGY